MSSFLFSVLGNAKESDCDFEISEKNYILDISDIRKSENEELITIGSPFDREEIDNEYNKEINKENIKTSYFKDYYINKRRPGLKSVAGRVSPSGEFLQV